MGRSRDRLRVVVGEPPEVAGETDGEDRFQPRPGQPAAEQPARQHRAERQHRDDLVRPDDREHVVAELARREYEDGTCHQRLGHPVRLAAGKAAQACQQAPQAQRQPRQVQPGQCLAHGRRLAGDVRAEQHQDVGAGHPGLGGQRRDRSDPVPVLGRWHVEAADRVDLRQDEVGEAEGDRRGHGQRGVIPPRPRGLRAPREAQANPRRAGHADRRGGGERGERIVDLRPRQEHADHDGDPPALANPVEDKQHQQDGDHRAGVVRTLHEDPGPVHERGGEQDAPGEQRAHDPLPAARGAAGEQRGQQHYRRVHQGRQDVHVVGAQAAYLLDEHVQRKFHAVERDVPEPPAAQQGVSVPHLPCLQCLPGRVRVQLIGLRLPQVAEIQDNSGRRQTRPPQDPRVTPEPSREPRTRRAAMPGGGPLAAPGQPDVHPRSLTGW